MLLLFNSKTSNFSSVLNVKNALCFVHWIKTGIVLECHCPFAHSASFKLMTSWWCKCNKPDIYHQIQRPPFPPCLLNLLAAMFPHSFLSWITTSIAYTEQLLMVPLTSLQRKNPSPSDSPSSGSSTVKHFPQVYPSETPPHCPAFKEGSQSSRDLQHWTLCQYLHNHSLSVTLIFPFPEPNILESMGFTSKNPETKNYKL